MSDVLSAYLVRARVPQPHEVLDSMANAKKVDLQRAWLGEIDVVELVPYIAFEDAMILRGTFWKMALTMTRIVGCSHLARSVHCLNAWRLARFTRRGH
jgi:hypothetical protein